MEAYPKGSIIFDGSTTTVRDIQLADDFVLVNYFSGFPKDEMEMIEDLDDDDWDIAYARLQKKYHEKILVYDRHSLAFLGELVLPAFVKREGFIFKDGYIWAQKESSIDEEEDFVMIYQLKIIKE